MKDRNIEIGDITRLDVAQVYATPSAELVLPESAQAILTLKKRMQYSLYGLLGVSFLPSLFVKLFGGLPLLILLLGYTAPAFWVAMLVFIFLLNKRLHSAGYALFRTLICIIPLVALYVVYRSSFDANQAAAGRT